ncbi:hypothetical protein PRZ48_002434 [Zasmidium cellare]|uniref:Scytalone dehydratase-like domain-containing protein n=1 Tax=Zasmidium cellare TaxID=395010 RepID=A0ABR0F683_ZASCE|nr:hypothetical protein PRZ48_002434 [Zasmidium cellare]
MSSSNVTFPEDQAFRQLTYNWAKSFDTKEWDLLRSITRDRVELDYQGLNPKQVVQVMSREDFVEGFAKKTPGDERLQTQHLIGGMVFSKTGTNTAKRDFQVRARYLKHFEDGSVKEWTAGILGTHFYERDGVEGDWGLAGLRPHTMTFEVGGWGDVFGEG